MNSSDMSRSFRNRSPAFMLVKRFFYSVLTPQSTRTVGVGIYGVPYISLMKYFLQNSRKRRPLNAAAFSLVIVFGMPFN